MSGSVRPEGLSRKALLGAALVVLALGACLAVLTAMLSDSHSNSEVLPTVSPGPTMSETMDSRTLQLTQKNNSSVFLDRKGSVYFQSLFKNSPEAVRDSLVVALKRGGVDEGVQMDAYFFTHRYIDNGGNIYELYDYIEQTPELSFLKEAAGIYPEVFKLIQDRRAPFTYSDQGIYAYLAYLEVFEKHGYASAAMLSTAANQYAKLAYYKKGIREEKSRGLLPTYPEYGSAEMISDLKKGQVLYRKAEEAVRVLMSIEETDDASVLDIVYAGEQLGSASRYFSAYGNPVRSETSAAQAFEFASKTAIQRVPELYLYVSLSNASTALLVDETTDFELRNAVYPFLGIRDEKMKQGGIVEKVILSRTEPAAARFRDLDLYSRKNITELGRRVPEFKTWLISNGWKEQDFGE